MARLRPRFLLLTALLLLGLAAPAQADGPAGAMHSCVATSGGTVSCWGDNSMGQLGHAATGALSTTPVTVDGLTDAKTVAFAGNVSCALRTNHTVACWGDNSLNQLGHDGAGSSSSVPVAVDDLSDATAISVGPAQGCAIRAVGKIHCWGWGQTGATEIETPGAVSVSVGTTNVCVVFADGHIECAGSNDMGQVGDGTTDPRFTLVRTSDITNARSVSVGFAHACAVLADKTVKCWGSLNQYGMLGNGTGVDSYVPVPVPGITDAEKITAGTYQTCVVRTGGDVKCWGWDFTGDPEEDMSVLHATPQDWPVHDVVGVIEGALHGCAVHKDGTVSCWGFNQRGGVGNGGATSQLTPSAGVTGLTGVTALAAGYRHACAIKADATVACWGDNSDGRTGHGTAVGKAFVPSAVTGLTGITGIAAGNNHTCARKTGGTVWCWGANVNGQLGDGTNDASSTPVQVSGITTATKVVAGNEFSCALLGDGSVQCWGVNSNGQLGISSNSNVPVTITDLPDPAMTPVVDLAAGDASICAITENGMMSTRLLRCWGAGYSGQLGSNDFQSSSTPVSVVDSDGWELENVDTLSVGGHHGCVVATAGPLCWGENADGQLGIGTTTNSAFATTSSMATPVAISGGMYHTCALSSDGTVQCWGLGNVGQLGLGDGQGYTLPHNVAGLTGVTAIAAGGYFTCAIAAGGTVPCWGAGDEGQLGDGQSRVLQATPAVVSGLSGATLLYPAWPSTDDQGGGDQGGGDNGGGSTDPIIPNTLPPVPPADDADDVDLELTVPVPPKVLPPTPKPAAVRLLGTKLVFANYVVKTGARSCPDRVRLTLKIQGIASSAGAWLKVKKSGSSCVVNAKVNLPAKTTGAKTASVKLSGTAIKTRTVTARRATS